MKTQRTTTVHTVETLHVKTIECGACREWQRVAERITLRDHQNIPHRNSTMRERYEGKELSYRGRE